jgi:IS5 family transposase
MSFEKYVFQEAYLRVKGLGDRLKLIKEQIDWEAFVPLIKSVFRDDKIVGGRPHTDEVLVVRCLVLQALYGLSDQELEYACCDRLSFRNFLGFPDAVPDFSTVWRIRDRLREAGLENKMWDELQRQIDVKGYKIEKGVIQDASFIEADLGRKRHYKEARAKKKGEEIVYTEKQEKHIDRDASFSIKNHQVFYGYKDHIKIDVGNELIRDYEVTTASEHDSCVDLVKEGDIGAYRDKGYFGRKPSAKGVADYTMDRASRNKPLTEEQHKRNHEISMVRAPGERPFSVLKRILKGGSTFIKSLPRVHIKEMFKCFAYNLYQLVTLRKKAIALALQKA